MNGPGPGRRVRQVAALAAVLFIGGCATPSPLPEPRGSTPLWELEGRLALSNGRDGGSGELRWQQGEAWAALSFVGALGQGSWQLTIDPGRASLALGGGETFEAENVDELVRRHFEWDLPLTELRHWILAEPAPNAPIETRRDGQGRLTVLRQSGWLVEFQGYGRAGAPGLPRKISARRDQDRVRLLVRQWTIHDS